jgi:fibro-slime domain-containing protein
MIIRNCRTAYAAAIVGMACAFSIRAQGGWNYIITDTLLVPVTFYDFHTNSNFNAGNCGTATGMVQTYLDADRKPVLLDPRCYNDSFALWYRPYGAPTAIFNPSTGRWSGLVAYGIRPNEWVGPQFNVAAGFANIVVYDSLPFILQNAATGTYQYIRINSDISNTLSGRGFQDEPDGHSFTMELHKEFIYQGGESFAFRGDDDVWVFINGRLALDLGGMQAETKRTLDLDASAAALGIVKGNKYWFDFFYAERNGPQSNCEITTNLLTPVKAKNIIVSTDSVPPANPLLIVPVEDTTMVPGQSINLYAYIYDDSMHLRTDFSSLVKWEFIGSNGSKFRSDTTAGWVTFAFPADTGCVTLRQSFIDPTDSSRAFRDSVRICNGTPHVPIDTTHHDTTTPPRPPIDLPVHIAVRDTNVNGQIDRLDITFADTLNLATDTALLNHLINSISLVGENGQVITLIPVGVVAINDSTIHVLIKENMNNPPNTGYTSISIDYNPVTPPGGPTINVITETIIDAAGSLLERAIFYPASGSRFDTLKLIFTESVVCAALDTATVAQIIRYLDSGLVNTSAPGAFSVELSCTQEYITSVRLIVDNSRFSVVPLQDSASLVPHAPSVVDRNGNTPPGGQAVVIEWGVKNTIKTAVSSNPFNPATSGIRPEIASFYRESVQGRTYGTVVGLKTVIALLEKTDGTFGHADIYDLLGNLIATGIPIEGTSSITDYGVYWDGKNQNGRFVGNGTYLAVITATDVFGVITTQRVKIGVSRAGQ